MKTTIKTLPVAKTEWKLEPAITKSGRVSKTRKEWKLVRVADEQECQGYFINVNGKQVEVFVPMENLTRDYHWTRIYTSEGEKIMALWQHGIYGSKIHKEPAIFNWKREELVTMTVYCDGQVKDSHKYLRTVLI